jgi:hypothetical protein
VTFRTVESLKSNGAPIRVEEKPGFSQTDNIRR